MPTNWKMTINTIINSAIFGIVLATIIGFIQIYQTERESEDSYVKFSTQVSLLETQTSYLEKITTLNAQITANPTNEFIRETQQYFETQVSELQSTNSTVEPYPINPSGNNPFYNFQEMFSNEDAANDWHVFIEPSEHTIFVLNGEYHLQQRTVLYNIKSIAPIQSLDGMTYSIEVEARLIPGTNLSSRYGIIFDWNGPASFYRFLITPNDQSFLVQRWENTWITLTNGSGTSTAINRGTLVNKIKLIRSGASIRIFVNNIQLNPGKISDSTYSGGTAGVIMVASDTANLYPDEVAFDDFIVWQTNE